MKFKVSSKLQYSINNLSTFIFNISVSKDATQTIIEENLNIDPYIQAEELLFKNSFNRSLRVESQKTRLLSLDYNALVDMENQVFGREKLLKVPVSKLPADVIDFLYPSRYCQSDRLFKFAQDKFGNIDNGYDIIYAICAWIYKNVGYVSGSTNSETTAVDTVTEREGVCRDFAHLGVSLSRALGIPARYLSCYAYQLNPPDFHACFEAYIGGHWIVFDPTHLAPLNGLVKIGIGRDAADISVATIYGDVSFQYMQVKNEVQEDGFQPLYMQDMKEQGVCL